MAASAVFTNRPIAARLGHRCSLGTTTPQARWTSPSIQQIRAASSPRCGTISASLICALTAALDIAIDPTNPSRIFAAMWDHFREPDLRTYGGVGSGVYRSTDGGTTWQRLTNGLPAASSTIGRIGIGLAASNPQRLYVIIIQTNGSFQGLYRTDDGGDSWTKLPNDSNLSGAQASYGWWFGRLWVDPLDQTHVFGAGVYLCESKNSGSSFTAEFSPHADDHAMAWDLKVANRSEERRGGKEG